MDAACNHVLLARRALIALWSLCLLCRAISPIFAMPADVSGAQPQRSPALAAGLTIHPASLACC
jgi:hypothetical protein